jgi:uncharacterized protein YceK
LDPQVDGRVDPQVDGRAVADRWVSKTSWRRLVAGVGLSLLAVAALSGCRADVVIDVTSSAKGAGVVKVEATLDADAAANVDSRTLMVKDLGTAGWSVKGPVPSKGGNSVLTLERSFANTTDATAILRSLTKADGPFSSLSLSRSSNLLGSELSFKGNVDLTAGLAALGDDQLRALTGSTSALGIDDTEVAKQLGQPINEAFTVALQSHLDGTTKSWKTPLGAVTPIAAKAKAWSFDALVAILTGVSALIGLVFVRKRRS